MSSREYVALRAYQWTPAEVFSGRPSDVFKVEPIVLVLSSNKAVEFCYDIFREYLTVILFLDILETVAVTAEVGVPAFLEEEQCFLSGCLAVVAYDRR